MQTGFTAMVFEYEALKSCIVAMVTWLHLTTQWLGILSNVILEWHCYIIKVEVLHETNLRSLQSQLKGIGHHF